MIREAKESDADYIAEFNYANCLETEHRELKKEVLDAGALNAFKRGLHYFVGEHAGKPVGIIGYIEYPDILN